MLVHDLTHTITEDILVWPGTEQPKLSEGSTFERDGFRETRLEIFSHVGTHMDAPAHMRVDRPQLDELPASAFCGTAWVLDARGCALGVRGIGLDTMGIDPMDAEGFPRHHIMFENSLVIVENLCNLTEIAGRRVFFAALPLKYKDADGAPVRAVGIED